MEKDRQSEWINSSFAFMNIEMLLLGEVQALGELDVELIEEFPKIKINSKLEEDLRRKRRYLLLSKLWVLGAYELIRFLNDINKKRNLLENKNKIKLKEILTTFSKVRVPLAKFQKAGKDKTLYDGVADSFFDSKKGVGWKVYSHTKTELKKEIFYRNDLGDLLLNLLREMKKDFWEDWKRKTKIELKGIEVVKKARKLILKNIPKNEIAGVYCKGSFPRREMNKSSDIDMLTILKHSKYLPKLEKLQKENKKSLGLPVHLSGISIYELKKGKHCKTSKKKASTSRVLKQIPNYKIIYGKSLEKNDFPVRSDKEDLESLIKFYKEYLIPAYKNKKLGFSNIVKGTFWLVEDEQKFKTGKSSTSWKNLANSIKDKKHIIHETLKLRLQPTKDKKVKREFLSKLERYIVYLEKIIIN